MTAPVLELVSTPEESMATSPVPMKPEPSLDELAADINREHEAAERKLRDSLMHARAAGEKLIQVKKKLPHGQFILWVKANCDFKYPSATLYMRIASKWHKLVGSNSERVSDLSLREAAHWLVEDELDGVAAALINIGVLEPGDLDGLGATEKRMLVREVRRIYEAYCYEPDDALRARRPQNWKPPVDQVFDRRSIRVRAAKAAADLKAGKIGPGRIGKTLFPLERKLLADEKRRKRGHSETPDRNDAAPPVRVESLTPFEWYVKRARDFIGVTRALLTEPHGLLEERVVLSDAQRGQLRTLIADMRSALEELARDACLAS